MSTGDLRNNLYKLQSKLKKIEFHGYLNCIRYYNIYIYLSFSLSLLYLSLLLYIYIY